MSVLTYVAISVQRHCRRRRRISFTYGMAQMSMRERGAVQRGRLARWVGGTQYYMAERGIRLAELGPYESPQRNRVKYNKTGKISNGWS